MLRKLLAFLAVALFAIFALSCSDGAETASDTTAEVEEAAATETSAETEETTKEAEETTKGPETTAAPETEPEKKPLKTVPVIVYNFAEATELDWDPTNHITDMRLEDGLLKLTSTGGDPYMISKQPLDIDASEIDLIRIKVLNMTDSFNCQFFFETDAEPFMSEDKSYRCIYDYAFSEPDSDEWNIVEIYTIDCFKWEGTIKRIRFDPSTSAGDIFIEYISLEKFE
ncbi:MAG TPA: hypothetical protein PK778_09415 [Bacillota bacterium]|nr:hypothetical protein [Bacillota bacterium]